MTQTSSAADLVPPSREIPVALLFPGQGAQHPRMATGLYGHEPVFTETMDEIFGLLDDGRSVRDDWLAENPVVGVDDVTRGQLLLFAVNYAMGRLVMSWGLRPAALLGHSVGEMAAATLAGVFTPADAMTVVTARMPHFQHAPPGGMLAVASSPTRVAPYLRDGVVIGAVNAPRQIILAGETAPLDEVRKDLHANGFTVRPVAAKVAYHSPSLLERAMLAEPAFAGVPLRPPSIPVYSACTGAPLTEGEATDPAFWAAQPAQPVLFWPALDALLAGGGHLIIDAGPSAGLAALARQHATVRSGQSTVLAALPFRPRDNDLETTRAARAAALAARTAEL